MQTAGVKSVGIIGAGRIGRAMAQTALRASRQVVIANSRGPESLTLSQTPDSPSLSEAQLVVRISWGSSDAASLTEPARRSPPGHQH
jgi:predicted dinucleotide-binding enzyme